MSSPTSCKCAVPLLLGLLGACGGGEGSSTEASSRTVASGSTASRHPLGWLGAEVCPTTQVIQVEVDGTSHAPGGVTVQAFQDNSPLAKAGVKVGDVMVQVGENWVPLKEDPTLDVLALIEQEISGGRQSIPLGCWRNGRLEGLVLETQQEALEVGLPVEVVRFEDGAAEALDWLVARQRDDGGFGAAGTDGDLGLTALATLALRAGGAAEPDVPQAWRDAHTRAADHLRSRATEVDSPQDLALAVLALSEEIGPLPTEVLLAAGPRVVSFGDSALRSSLPKGVPAGAMTFEITSPEELGDMLENMGGEGSGFQVMTIGGDGAHGQDGAPLEIPEGSEFTISSGMVMGGEPGELPGMPFPSGPRPELGPLLEQMDPERPTALTALDTIVQRLIATQSEDGGFGADDAPDTDRLVATTLSLSAMGAVQRVGGEVPAEPLEKGCGWLRAQAHDGKVAAAVARGADRRVESGRAASVAWPFRALGCPEGDDLVAALLDYSDEAGYHLLHATEGLPFHLLATAIVRRERGLVHWQRFYDEFRLSLVCWQQPDGQFALPENSASSWEGPDANVFATAWGALLLSLQAEDRLPVLLHGAENPYAPTVDGHGKRQEPAPSEASATDLPEGATMVTDPAAIEALLESLGVEGGLEGMMQGSVQITTDDGDG